ncbi:MAG: hypothetical protein WKG07_04705 [Hymenobacter sp.]
MGQAFRRVCRIRGLHVVALDRAALDVAERGVRRPAPCASTSPGPSSTPPATSAWTRPRPTTPAATAKTRPAPACWPKPAPRTARSCSPFPPTSYSMASRPPPTAKTDPARPLNEYGRSKLLAEAGRAGPAAQRPRGAHQRFFSAWDEHNFVHHALRAARARPALRRCRGPVHLTHLRARPREHRPRPAARRRTWHAGTSPTRAPTPGPSWPAWPCARPASTKLPCRPRPAASFRLGRPAARATRVLGSAHGPCCPSVESGLQRHLEDERLLSLPHPPAILVG